MVKNRSALALALVAALMLSACAPRYKGPDFNVHYYPECYDPIDQMCKAQDNSGKIKATTGGAIFGGIAGFLGGMLASGGDWKVGLGTAAATTIIGATAGYFTAHLVQIKDQNERLEALKAQLGQQADDMDLTQASVEKAYRCYRDRLAELKKGIRSGLIGKEEAKARAEEIRAGMTSLKKFWQERDAAVQASLNEYDKFLVDQEKQARDMANQKRIAESRKARAKMASNQTKYVAANNKVHDEIMSEFNDISNDTGMKV